MRIHLCLLLCNPTTRVGFFLPPQLRYKTSITTKILGLPCHNHTYLLPAHLPQNRIVLMREKGGVIGLLELHYPWNHHHLIWFQLPKLTLPYLMTIYSCISIFCLKHQLKILLLRPLRGTPQKFIFIGHLGTRTFKIPSACERKKDVSYVKNSGVYTCCCKI